MKNIRVVFKREVQAYFLTPLAYVFIFIFLILSMSLCFVFGRFLEGEDASLDYTFFQFHPWLFMVLGPAIGMRLWSEENREGTIELLLTMPISTWQAIIGKFLAACLVLVAALVMTFPVILTVNFISALPSVFPIPRSDNLVISGAAPSLSRGVPRTPPAGSLVLTGIAPTVTIA
jgi:ABC-2 type transport system permease protein